MKSSSILTLAAAVVGFALGWALKPASDAVVPHKLANSEPPARVRPNQSELVAPSNRSPESARAVSLAEAESQSADPLTLRREQALSQAGGQREKARLARFAEALGLEVDQLEAVAQLLAKHKGSTNASADSLLTDAADGELGFDDALLALLNDDQKSRLQAFKTRTLENQVEASAMKDLTKVMNTVDLSAEQRETLLNTYREKNRVEYDSEPDTWSLLTDTGGHYGRSSSSSGRYRDIFTNPEVTNDPQRLAQAIAEEDARQIEEDLELISDELTDQQLSELRAAKRNATTALFGNSIRDPRFR